MKILFQRCVVGPQETKFKLFSGDDDTGGL